MDDRAGEKDFGGAAGSLRAAEDGASAGAVTADGGVAGANEAETRGFYRGTGRQQGGGDKKKKAKGFLKGKGPMGLILGLILGVGGVMGGAQMFQPFSLVEQFRETFNSMQTSVSTRSNTFFRMQMDSGRVKNPIKGRIFGSDTFKITSRQASKLSTQGIEVDDDFEGTGIRVLKFDDGTGEIRIVAADDSSVAKLNELNLKGFDTDNVKYNAEAISFKNLYEGNADFFNGYNKGSMTWRGAIANWFGTVTAAFLSSNKITRNIFRDFLKKVEESQSGNTRTVALELMEGESDTIKEGGYKTTGVEEETNEDGQTTYRETTVEEGPSTVSRESLTTENVSAKLTSIAGTVQKGANVICTVMNTLGAIGLLVTASEAVQIISLVTSYFEAIDKVKAGNGDDSPINELASILNEKKANTNTVLESTGVAWNSSNENANFRDGGKGGITTLTTLDVTTEKTAMESSGIAALYGGGRVNPNDPSVQSFNFTNSINQVAGGLGSSMAMFETCAIAKIASNAVTAVGDAIGVVTCIAGLVGAVVSFGTTAAAGCSELVISAAKGIALSVAIGVTVAGVISTITPVVARMMTRDLISDIGGEDLGNALTSGANMYLGNTHRSNGGSLATDQKYAEFAVAQQRVIAENAKYERQNRDPFDMTSKYTFLGTLMTQMMNFTSANSLTSFVSSTGSVLSSSIIAMSPAAMAYDISEDLPTMDEYKDTCPYLWSIGAIGDAYCNPYSITDMSTIELDPADVIDVLSNDDNFLNDNADGNVVINGNSDLAKYILYCDNRASAFGMVDQNIANELGNWGTVDTGSSFVNSMTNSAIGAVPVIGDLIDVVDNTQLLENLGYISGESCVAGNTVDRSGSPGWNKAKYYQRFIEDQSLAETIGLFGENGESAVATFLNEYYEEHPLDNSYEGILARYSGLTKDNVIALLDVIDYYNYIANYDAAARYAFGAPVVEVENEVLFDDENVVAEVHVVLLNEISFADIRNRTALV